MYKRIIEFALLGYALFLPFAAFSQEVTNITEGVSGDIDAHRRGPVLTVTVTYPTDPARVAILADAYVPSHEFTKYPLKFDFFVDRRLFSSQIRSPELNGPVGVDIGPDIATVPFNYSVVATVLHPNRQYTTVLQGAATGSAGTGTAVDCTLTQSTDTSDEIFVSEAVEPALQSDNSYTVSFTTPNGSNTATAAVTAKVVLTTENDTTTATTTVTVTKNGQSQTFTMTGDAEVNSDRKLTSLDVATEDQNNTLACS